MKRISKLFAVVMAVAMIAAIAIVPASAGFSYTPVAGGTTTFYKDLVMSSSANVPNASFTFTIAPGTAVSASAGTAPISAGIGSPTITSPVTFSPSDSTTAGTPSDSTATGSKYARKTITVDFSGVDFPAPGIYRYAVTESGTNAGVSNDATPTRYLDVYVTANGETGLTISRYLLHTPSSTSKSTGFENTYASSNLTLSKTVTGNQGSREKYFKFDVTISNATAGTVYTVDRSNADTTITANGSTLSTYNNKTNPASLTVGSNGTVTGTFYLQSGQSVVIRGLATGTKYAITEANEDYTPSYKINNGSATSNASCPATTISANTTVAYTNNRAGTVPTGVALSMMPGLAMVAGALGCFIATKKKKDSEAE